MITMKAKPAVALRTLLKSPAMMGGFIILTSVTAMSGALISEHVFGMDPCILCRFQRIPYILAIFLGFFTLIPAQRGALKPAAFLIFLCALLFLTGSAIAFYHTGVEQHWWASVFEACKLDFGGDSAAGTSLIDKIQATPSVPCDVIPWQDPLIGLSMAAWNAIISFGLFVMTLTSAIMITRKANGL